MKTLQIDDEFGERLLVGVLTEDYKDHVLDPLLYLDSPSDVMNAYRVLLDYYMNLAEKKAFAEWIYVNCQKGIQ